MARVFSLLSLAVPVFAGTPDTLRNHEKPAALTLLRYGEDVGSGNGLVLGHNSHHREQYAEKYGIQGRGEVTGVVAHLGGKFANGDNLAEFSLFKVAPNGLPGEKIGGRKIRYGDLDLSGAQMGYSFDTAIAVEDSFFLAFGLGDYAHGGYEGDTLGLHACEIGCRTEQDLELFGRNVVQWHNHAKMDWHDLYYQNFTPIAVHLALYPILVRTPAATKPSRKAEGWAATFRHGNGGGSVLSLRRILQTDDKVRIRLLDLRGREVFDSGERMFPAGISSREIPIGNLRSGILLLRIQSRGRTESQAVVIP